SGNGGNGIWVEGGNYNTFDTNDVRSNGGAGLLIDSEFYGGLVSSPAAGNLITKSTIYNNARANIVLGSGTPNNRQESPIITGAVRDPLAGTTTVTMTMPTRTGVYDIELFRNSAPGKPAGEAFVMSQRVSISAVGTPFTLVVNEVNSDFFSATATEPENRDTSEYSPMVSARAIPTPGVSVLPTSIDFGDVVIGRQSSQGTISVTSQGTAPYIISALRESSCTGPSICSTGSFICSTSCVEGSSYAAGNSCTITASFAPTTLGPQSKTLALCDNASGSPRMLSLAGNGVPVPLVDIAFTPSAWFFGEALVNTRTPSKTFRLSNAGANQVYLGPVSVSGDFVQSGNTCGASLAGGASCTVDIAFAAAVKGIVSGSLDVTGSNTPIAAKDLPRRKVTAGATTATASASLQGSGVQFGDLRLPNAISFGTSTLHGSPARQSVVLSNTGNGPLSIGNISVAGPFAMSNGCGATLGVSESCTVALEFNPLTLGSFSGTLTIVTDAPGGARAIPLTAQVIAESRPVVVVDRSTAGFGDRLAGTETGNTRINVKNEGSQEAILGALVITSDTGATDFFIRSNTCGGTLAPQASCFAEVYMKPSGFGDRKATLFVPSNARESPAHVDLSGTGCRPFVAGANRSGSSRSNCAP
ncbi:MAG TPA: choice-of-anchor D domain-containing protein, partial [Usitatibacter sp.]|nr:choice-of-anchor D domain-containing protein [Usitatibacter sp.]